MARGLSWTEEDLAAYNARKLEAPQPPQPRRMLTALLPLRTISEANASQREHWATKHRRHKHQRGQTLLLLGVEWGILLTNWQTPATITLTRIAPRKLDEGDNLAMSMKSIRDGVADWLKTADNDPLLTWAYRQERGKVREYAVRITLEE